MTIQSSRRNQWGSFSESTARDSDAPEGDEQPKFYELVAVSRRADGPSRQIFTRRRFSNKERRGCATGVKRTAQKLQTGTSPGLHGAAVPYFRFASWHPVRVRMYCSWVPLASLIEWVGWVVLAAVQACMKVPDWESWSRLVHERFEIWCAAYHLHSLFFHHSPA